MLTGLCAEPWGDGGGFWGNAGPMVTHEMCKANTWIYDVDFQTFTDVNGWDAFTGGCLSLDVYSGLEVWYTPLVDKTVAVLLFNQSPYSSNITVNWADIGLASGSSAQVRDLWAHTNNGTYVGHFTAEVRTHASVMLKVTPA